MDLKYDLEYLREVRLTDRKEILSKVWFPVSNRVARWWVNAIFKEIKVVNEKLHEDKRKISSYLHEAFH
mgnify:CR=1 FL=1